MYPDKIVCGTDKKKINSIVSLDVFNLIMLPRVCSDGCSGSASEVSKFHFTICHPAFQTENKQTKTTNKEKKTQRQNLIASKDTKNCMI